MTRDRHFPSFSVTRYTISVLSLCTLIYLPFTLHPIYRNNNADVVSGLPSVFILPGYHFIMISPSRVYDSSLSLVSSPNLAREAIRVLIVRREPFPLSIPYHSFDSSTLFYHNASPLK